MLEYISTGGSNMNYIITKDVCLQDGTKIYICINIPLEAKVTDERADEFMNDTIINQIMRGFKTAKYAYENSLLPNKFLNYGK